MKLLDLFCGRWGWSRAFAARGWECVGVDLVEPAEIPQGCSFVRANIKEVRGIFHHRTFYRESPCPALEQHFDFVCASPPCESFSVFGMRHFHPDPPYPSLGIELFNHTRALGESSGVPYIMENVRAAQQFVGPAVNHCGPFYLWGNGVPPIMPQGITKGFTHDGMRDRVRETRRESIAAVATIPPELANCVADYAEAVLGLSNSERAQGYPQAKDTLEGVRSKGNAD